MRCTQVLSIFILAISKLAMAEKPLPDLKIQNIEEDIYLHISYENIAGWGLVASNGLIVLDGKNAYIIDTPISTKDTQALVKWIKEQGFILKGSISTHFHGDSAAGIPYLNSVSIPTYASKLTNDLIDKDGRERAKHSFDGVSYWLPKDQIEVFYPGAGHSSDNVVVWMPNKKVLFGGCFVKSTSLGYLGDADIESWPSSAQALISRYGTAKFVVPGHGEVGDVSLLEDTKMLALDAIVSKKKMQPPANAPAD